MTKSGRCLTARATNAVPTFGSRAELIEWIEQKLSGTNGLSRAAQMATLLQIREVVAAHCGLADGTAGDAPDSHAEEG